MIYVLSVPHTGTHYTTDFLERLGVHWRQLHSQPSSFEDVWWWEPGSKVVIPMRDPVLQYYSTHRRSNEEATSASLNLASCVSCWRELGRLEERLEGRLDCERLWLDRDELTELKRIAAFAGEPMPANVDTSPKNVNSRYASPTNYAMWEQHLADDKNSDEPNGAKEALEALKPFRERYGYLAAD